MLRILSLLAISAHGADVIFAPNLDDYYGTLVDVKCSIERGMEITLTAPLAAKGMRFMLAGDPKCRLEKNGNYHTIQTRLSGCNNEIFMDSSTLTIANTIVNTMTFGRNAVRIESPVGCLFHSQEVSIGVLMQEKIPVSEGLFGKKAICTEKHSKCNHIVSGFATSALIEYFLFSLKLHRRQSQALPPPPPLMLKYQTSMNMMGMMVRHQLHVAVYQLTRPPTTQMTNRNQHQKMFKVNRRGHNLMKHLIRVNLGRRRLTKPQANLANLPLRKIQKKKKKEKKNQTNQLTLTMKTNLMNLTTI